MAIVAHTYPFVIGVDTHARKHTYAILVAATGELLFSEEFPATAAGLRRASGWVARRTDGDLAVLWVIECVATYGARLARMVTEVGYEVVEAARMDARARRGIGKSDPLDAQRIAAAVLPLEVAHLRRPRADDGLRAALRVLTTAREHMTTERTSCVNALTALLRAVNLGADAPKPLTNAQISDVAAWRSRTEDLALSVARIEAVAPGQAHHRARPRTCGKSGHAQVTDRAEQGLATAGEDRHRTRHCRRCLRRLVAPRSRPQRSRLRRTRRCQSDSCLLGEHQSTPAQPGW